MRHPFYMDYLGYQDRRKIKRLFLRVFAFYLSLCIILVVGSVVRAKFVDPPTGSIRQNADFR